MSALVQMISSLNLDSQALTLVGTKLSGGDWALVAHVKLPKSLSLDAGSNVSLHVHYRCHEKAWSGKVASDDCDDTQAFALLHAHHGARTTVEVHLYSCKPLEHPRQAWQARLVYTRREAERATRLMSQLHQHDYLHTLRLPWRPALEPEVFVCVESKLSIWLQRMRTRDSYTLSRRGSHSLPSLPVVLAGELWLLQHTLSNALEAKNCSSPHQSSLLDLDHQGRALCGWECVRKEDNAVLLLYQLEHGQSVLRRHSLTTEGNGVESTVLATWEGASLCYDGTLLATHSYAPMRSKGFNNLVEVLCLRTEAWLAGATTAARLARAAVKLSTCFEEESPMHVETSDLFHVLDTVEIPRPRCPRHSSHWLAQAASPVRKEFFYLDYGGYLVDGRSGEHTRICNPSLTASQLQWSGARFISSHSNDLGSAWRPSSVTATALKVGDHWQVVPPRRAFALCFDCTGSIEWIAHLLGAPHDLQLSPRCAVIAGRNGIEVISLTSGFQLRWLPAPVTSLHELSSAMWLSRCKDGRIQILDADAFEASSHSLGEGGLSPH